jgi:hypothetical protein
VALQRAVAEREQALQRGRGPETAESHATGMRALPQIRPLQRGRGPETAESPSLRRAEVRVEDASTGPRSGDRGESTCSKAKSPKPALQRGRGPETAERLSRRGSPCRGNWLFNGAAVRRPRRAVLD